IYVDASTDWGIGILINKRWAAFRLAPDWKLHLPGRDICWLETVAVELLLYYLAELSYRNVRLLVHSDNQGTIGAFAKSRSPNVWINLALRRMYGVTNSCHINLQLEYVNTKDNLADPISRGILGSHDYRLGPLVPGIIPEEFLQFITYV
ncbi:hypothetical protein MPER_16327, partial [Moniliophthora perniciosa FA553]